MSNRGGWENGQMYEAPAASTRVDTRSPISRCSDGGPGQLGHRKASNVKLNSVWPTRTDSATSICFESNNSGLATRLKYYVCSAVTWPKKKPVG